MKLFNKNFYIPFLKASTHSIAVYPAVPILAASKADKDLGKGINHSFLTEAFSENPPK